MGEKRISNRINCKGIFLFIISLSIVFVAVIFVYATNYAPEAFCGVTITDNSEITGSHTCDTAK